MAMVIDRKTGKKRPVNQERSRTAKIAFQKNKSKRIAVMKSRKVRQKISESLKEVHKTGRTKAKKGIPSRKANFKKSTNPKRKRKSTTV